MIEGRNQHRVAFLLLFYCLLFSAQVYAQQGKIVEEVFQSDALKGNLLNDPTERRLYVYLPPGYQKSGARRYPVIYLLHGYGSSYRQWMAGGKVWNIRDVLDRLIRQGKIREMLVVMPDGSNKYGGSFYTNSVTNGNWEDYLTKDLTAFIDGKYRTLRQAASRGIAGHSMGGYGAIKAGMKHPETYGAVYGLSACCLGWGSDLASGNPAWDRALSLNSLTDIKEGDFYTHAFLGLASAWSPNPQRAPFFVDWPFEGPGNTRVPVVTAYHRWSANMPVWMVDQYRSNLAQLRAIAFDVGRQDEFAHIPVNNRALSQALTRNNVRHTFEEYEGTHGSKLGERIETKMLPFFSQALAFEIQTEKHQVVPVKHQRRAVPAVSH